MKKKLVIVLILFLITLPTLIPFFNIKFFYTQDYIFIARINQMTQALSSGNFPVRWVPDLRYGEPLFNFYSPLPYYLGGVIGLLGINFIWVAKILFILSSVLSAIAMYILCQKMFGKKAGFLAAILYVYAPYRAVDIYVRGALSETWAFIFLPLIFYTSLLLSEKINVKRIAFLSIALAGLFLTHNVTTLMFLPFLGLWWGYLLFKERKWKLIPIFFIAFTLGLGLSAFFLLPAFFERDFIQTKYLIVGYFNFRAHFVAFSQLFSTFWGYGSSLWGRDDGLSFQIGLVNWTVMSFGIILGIIKRDRKFLILILFLGFSFLLSIFMQHNKSTFIWEAIPNMAFIQFPWRFLSISVFITAIVGAAITPYLNKRLNIVYVILIVASVLISFQYFRPKEYTDDAFFDKFLNRETMRKGVDLTKDYLPIWVQTTDGEIINIPKTEKGRIEIINFQKQTSNATASINVLSDAQIIVPITYFPGWIVIANGNSIKQENPSEQGLIRFKLPKGNYKIEFEFKDTPVRMIGNIISIISVITLAVFLTFKKVFKK